MIDPESASNDLHYIKIRESMIKFSSEDWTLHICNYSRSGKNDIYFKIE